MSNAGVIEVEVAYARADEQALVTVTVPAGATLRQAIEASGILERFPEIDLDSQKVGVFSRIAGPDDVVQERDRVEIYRSLIADPKEMRRQRARRRQA